jgi:hypothetical protein
VGDDRGETMRYMLLICNDDDTIDALSPDELAAAQAEYVAFGEEMERRGILLGGQQLGRATTATTVRVRDGEVLVADGPFAETKEQIGGYYLVDCRDLDEAIEVAALIPGARHGTVEVRPLWEQ